MDEKNSMPSSAGVLGVTGVTGLFDAVLADDDDDLDDLGMESVGLPFLCEDFLLLAIALKTRGKAGKDGDGGGSGSRSVEKNLPVPRPGRLCQRDECMMTMISSAIYPL